jgi:hypothetical protein
VKDSNLRPRDYENRLAVSGCLGWSKVCREIALSALFASRSISAGLAVISLPLSESSLLRFPRPSRLRRLAVHDRTYDPGCKKEDFQDHEVGDILLQRCRASIGVSSGCG